MTILAKDDVHKIEFSKIFPRLGMCTTFSSKLGHKPFVFYVNEVILAEGEFTAIGLQLQLATAVRNSISDLVLTFCISFDYFALKLGRSRLRSADYTINDDDYVILHNALWYNSEDLTFWTHHAVLVWV
ncbi:unnamed protein product [Leptosia nina]|uniref:Uncharacterized protein n=1 Tax=Leptosia nina TaxID=320188 RepID=A0AAV1JN11_9NEOP